MKKEFEVTEELFATQGQRFGNYIIDTIVYYILAFGFGAVILVISELTNYYDILYWLQEMGTIEEYLLGFVIVIVYYSTSEILLQRTIGKMITNTIVVMEDGSRPDAGTIFKRSLCRIIPFEQFSFLGSTARGWHDTISDTYVVKKKELEIAIRQSYEFDQIGTTEENQY